MVLSQTHDMLELCIDCFLISRRGKEQMHKITVSTLAFDEFICFVSTKFVKRSNFHVRIRCGTKYLHLVSEQVKNL